jgi:exodeoxyribonuclease VII small subunit
MKSFEEQLKELEQVVEQLERGELSLEDSVTLFERGVKLSDACKGQLASAESRIQVLIQPREHGPVRTEDLEIGEDEDGFSEDEEEG